MFALSLLVLTVASADCVMAPTLRIGAKLTRSLESQSVTWNDSLGEVVRITYRDPYTGASCEVVYGPLSLFSLRMDLAAYEFFDAGGSALAVLESPCLDVLVEPPVRWRVAPYVWAGFRMIRWWGSQGTPDPRFNGEVDHEFHAGIGVRYRLSRRVELFGESRWLTDYTWLTYAPFRDYPSGYGTTTVVGLCRAEVGVRYGATAAPSK